MKRRGGGGKRKKEEEEKEKEGEEEEERLLSSSSAFARMEENRKEEITARPDRGWSSGRTKLEARNRYNNTCIIASSDDAPFNCFCSDCY